MNHTNEHRLQIVAPPAPGPLPARAVRRLVAERLGPAADEDARALAAAAGGDPLLLDVLLDGLRAEGVTPGPGRARTPLRLQRLVPDLLRGSPAGWQLLRVAAVLGRACPVAELAAMTRQSTAELLPALDALLDAGLLTWVGDELAFRHDLVWWAVLDGLRPALRQALTADRDRIRAAGPAPAAPCPAAAPGRPAAADVAGWASFTGIERAVAELVAQGMTNRQIATRVRLSPHTVNYHLRVMFRRLGICSRAELVRHVPPSAAA